MTYVRKIGLSTLCGLLILLLTWLYQNYDFTFSVEDKFFKRFSFLKDDWYRSKSDYKAAFVFINTGKDLALMDYGNVAVSDRDKIYKLLANINNLASKPVYTVLDLQFYYPFTINEGVDSLLQQEINKSRNLVIPVVKDDKDEIKNPIYKASYATSDYTTYGAGFNKFVILKSHSLPSIPIVMQQQIQKAKYKSNFLFSTCNNNLCLSAIWPTYFLNNGMVRKNEKPEVAQFYNIGEMLLDMESNPSNYRTFFENKIVMVGNFEEDVHITPVGKMSGPVLLANIYLSLLNRQHIVRTGYLVLLLIFFSALSYIALFSEIPQVKLNMKILFSSYLNGFLKTYVTYFGCMILLSLLLILIYDMPVGLFLPPFLFSGIEYIRHKKYKDLF